MPGFGTKNLIPMNQRTKEEQKVIATKGGIASGVSRRMNRDIKEQWTLLGDSEPSQDFIDMMRRCGAEYKKGYTFLDCVFSLIKAKLGTDKVTLNDLLKFIESYADYTGQKPTQKTENIGMPQTIVQYVRDAEFDEINKHIDATILDEPEEQ